MQPFPPYFFDPNRRTGRRTATCSTETAQLFFGDSCPAAPFLLFPRRGVELVPVRTQDSSPSAASGRHCATRSLQGIVLRRVFIRYRGAQFSARGPFLSRPRPGLVRLETSYRRTHEQPYRWDQHVRVKNKTFTQVHTKPGRIGFCAHFVVFRT